MGTYAFDKDTERALQSRFIVLAAVLLCRYLRISPRPADRVRRARHAMACVSIMTLQINPPSDTTLSYGVQRKYSLVGLECPRHAVIRQGAFANMPTQWYTVGMFGQMSSTTHSCRIHSRLGEEYGVQIGEMDVQRLCPEFMHTNCIIPAPTCIRSTVLCTPYYVVRCME